MTNHAAVSPLEQFCSMLAMFNDDQYPADIRIGKAFARAHQLEIGLSVSNPEGTWLWCQLMDWCKSQGVSPSNYDALFAIAAKAHRRDAAVRELVAADLAYDKAKEGHYSDLAQPSEVYLGAIERRAAALKPFLTSEGG